MKTAKYRLLFPVFLGECGCPLRGGHRSNFLLYKAMREQFSVSADFSICEHTVDVGKIKVNGQLAKLFRYWLMFFAPIKDYFRGTEDTYITGTTGILIFGILSKFFDLRFIAVCRDTVFLGVDKHDLLSRLRFKFMLSGLKAAKVLVVNSAFLKNEYENLIPDKNIFVIYPEIVTTFTNIGPAEAVSFRKIGFVGAQEPKHDKGYRIIEELALVYPEYEFHIFGDCKNHFSKLCVNMIFRGWTPEDEMYSSVDLMIVPSVWAEPFGRVAAEAISKGVPVFSSDVGGLCEIVPAQFRLAPTSDAWIKSFQVLIDSVLAGDYEVVFSEFKKNRRFSAETVYCEFFEHLQKEDET